MRNAAKYLTAGAFAAMCAAGIIVVTEKRVAAQAPAAPGQSQPTFRVEIGRAHV